MKICWANTNNLDDADFVILGIPDESKSHALRKGTSKAPDMIRRISNLKDVYIRNDKTSLGFPLYGNKSKIFDYGNIKRNQIKDTIDKIVSKSKIPIVIGGDHSISVQVIKSISKKINPLSLVYFDAHPDLISSTRNYYGSVFYDALPFIDISSSLEIGIRTPEQEEITNIKKIKLEVITPFDIVQKGLTAIEKKIGKKIGKNVYVSFDMDAIDPAYAPGVSVPVPNGLRNVEATYLLKSIASKGLIGMDLMEVCPQYDIKDKTSHLASRMLIETISSV